MTVSYQWHLGGALPSQLSRRSSPPAGLPSDRHRAVPGRKGGMPQRPIVARCNQVTAEAEEVRDGGADIDEPLCLKRGFEPPHSPLSYPGLLMRQLGPVVGVPTGVVRSSRQQRAKGHRVTPQLVRHDRPRLATEVCQHVPEEEPGGSRVPPLLQQHVDDFTVLVDGPHRYRYRPPIRTKTSSMKTVSP